MKMRESGDLGPCARPVVESGAQSQGMRVFRHSKFVLLLSLVMVCLGCGEAGLDSRIATLQRCPQDDTPWRQAMIAAEDESRVEELEAAARELAGRCSGLWAPWWTHGLALTSLGRYQEAEEAYRKALQLAQASPDSVGIARSSDELAWFAYLGARHDESEELFQQALAAALDAGRRDLEIFIRSNHAGLLRDVGDLAGASDEYEVVLAGIDELGLDERTRRIAHFNQGSLLIELGDAVGAEASFRTIYEAAEASGDKDFADGAALALGNLSWAQENLEASAEWLNRVGTESPAEHAKAQLGLGLIRMEQNDPQTAFELFSFAAEEAAQLDRPFSLLARAYSARAVLALGDAEKARRILVALFDEVQEEDPILASLWERRWFLGLAAKKVGDAAGAREHFEAAIEILSTQRMRLDPSSEGLRFLRERSEPFVDLALLLTENFDRSSGDDSGRILEVLRAAKTLALREDFDESPSSGAEQLLAIRDALEDDEIVLDYLIGNKRGIVVAIKKEKVSARAIEGRDEILPALRLLRNAVEDAHSAALPASARRAGESLFAGLIAPLVDELDDVRRIYIVPHRELAVLSWSVLPWPTSAAEGRDSDSAPSSSQTFLGHRFELASLPWAAPPPEMTDVGGPVLLAGQPVGLDDSLFGPLPWVSFELSSLRKIWQPATAELLTKEEFSLDGLRSRPLERFGLLHIASHAVASTTDPRRCGVMLSKGERLGLDEIAKLPLDSALVVLSACRTGEGEVVPGEGVVSLGWALLKTGARGAVVSRWVVDDNSSARLMIDFHRSLREGIDPVAALSRARRSAWERNPHPAHWAAFDIMLRPRPSHARSSKTLGTSPNESARTGRSGK